MIKVVLVEDHIVVRDGLCLLLSSYGDIQVVGQGCNGREGVQLVEELQPDVVLMDIAMPEMNGIEATRVIRKASPSIQVVILSMYSNIEYIYRALEAGARGYLLKEGAGKEVATAIRAVHSGHRYLCEKVTSLVVDDYLLYRQMIPTISVFDNLSQREREVLQLIVEGRSSVEIAAALQLAVSSIETYRSRMMAKLNINDLPALVKFAIQHGLISVS